MEIDSGILCASSLFSGMTEKELLETMQCLSPIRRSYEKNEIIWHRGESISSIGMPLSGQVHILQEDFLGNRSIVSGVIPGELFGDAYAFLPDEKLRVSALMAEAGTILFFNVNRLLTTCANSCERHARMIRNLSMAIAKQNLALTRKLSFLGKRSIREKLVDYLSNEAMLHGSASFTIPYNRQELADYLCVDRSALSKELCRLRDEGYLTFRMNRFTLRDAAHTELWSNL